MLKISQIKNFPFSIKVGDKNYSKMLEDAIKKNPFKVSKLIRLYKKRKSIQAQIDAVLPPLQAKISQVNDEINKLMESPSLSFETFIEKKIVEGYSPRDRELYEKEHAIRDEQLKASMNGNGYYAVNYEMFDPEYDDFEILDMETDKDGRIRFEVGRKNDMQSISGIQTYYLKTYKTAWITNQELKNVDNLALDFNHMHASDSI